MKNFIVCFLMSFLCAVQAGKAQTAELQLIHASADASVDTVDIYVNGILSYDDMAYLTATSFATYSTSIQVEIGIAPSNSVSVNDTIKNFSLVLTDGDRYTAILNGLVNPASFSPNPNGIGTELSLRLQNDMFNPGSATETYFYFYNGSSDAPASDIRVRYVNPFQTSLVYSSFSPSLNIISDQYLMDIVDAPAMAILKSFEVDLTPYGNSLVTFFMAGFVDSTQNQDGPSLSLHAALDNGTVITFPSVSRARFQFIHNSADTSLSFADVYYNGNLYIDNAQIMNLNLGMHEIDAATMVNIGIADSGSTSVNDTLRNFQLFPENGNSYVAMLMGVWDTATYALNPDGHSTSLALVIKEHTHEEVTVPGTLDYFFMHGSTDLPAVDIVLRTITPVVYDAEYQDTTGYFSIPDNNIYIVDITSPGGDTIYSSYQMDGTIPNYAMVLYTCGFYDPSQNNNGISYHLRTASTVADLGLFEISLARLQLIQNCADPAADSIDLYLDGTLLVDDFKFRTATSYLDFNSYQPLNLGIAPATSTSVDDTLKNIEINLYNGENYVGIISGLLTPPLFDANPNGVNTGLDLKLQGEMNEFSIIPTDVDVIPFHGSTDSPQLDLMESGNVFVDNIGYTDFFPYISVVAGIYTFELTPANNNQAILRSFYADFTNYGGSTAVILASGFLNPVTNLNGAPFGLLAVFNDGSAVLLSNITGLEQVNANGFTMFPNPASDIVMIHSDKTFQQGEVSLVNQLGQTVFTEIIHGGIQQFELNLAELSKGLYLVKIKTEKETLVSKLIVQ